MLDGLGARLVRAQLDAQTSWRTPVRKGHAMTSNFFGGCSSLQTVGRCEPVRIEIEVHSKAPATAAIDLSSDEQSRRLWAPVPPGSSWPWRVNSVDRKPSR